MRQQMDLAGYAPEVEEEVERLKVAAFAPKFWAKDPSAWAPAPADEVGSMLGWIDVIPKVRERLPEIEAFAQDILEGGFTRVVLCGMGGSSLAPYVLSKLFPDASLPLLVLDSTHPDEVLKIQNTGELHTTLFIVASKSGTTAEPNAFDRYFFDLVGRPRNFVAITDPDSPFAQSAEERGYRKVFLNYADIGGRYSALSLFGMVPAALLGINVREFLDRAERFAQKERAAGFGEAFRLGAAMGILAKNGRDKLTFITDDVLDAYGLWLEQLVAESTGKQGRGILPVAGEEMGPPEAYGDDRFFVFIGKTLPADGMEPYVRTELMDPYDLGAEFLRWEIATATAGAVLEINPFDQPNVQESKDVTKQYLRQVEEKGDLPPRQTAPELGDFLLALGPGDYVALQAYLPYGHAQEIALKSLQERLRNETHAAVTFGYGPRFLHSTGQYHKGGPPTGHFIQVVDTPEADAPIPGQRATWAQFVDAQARGDREALEAHGRPVLTITYHDLITPYL